MLRATFLAIVLVFVLCKSTNSAPAHVLSKTHFKIVVIESPPYVFEDKENQEEDGTVTYAGFYIDLLKEIQSRMNFTYELYLVPDARYGVKDEHGEWNGLMRELVSGNADMVLAPLTVTSKRSADVLFSAPIMNSGIVPLFKKPEQGAKLPFRDLVDLARDGNIEYGTVKGGATQTFFAENQYELYKAMGEFMAEHEDDVMARNYEEGAERVREGDYVFFGEEPMLNYVVGKTPCDLIVVGKPINARHYAFGFPKEESETADQFSQVLLETKEDGMFFVLRNKWWENDCTLPKLCVCEKNVSSEESASQEAGSGEAEPETEAAAGAEWK